MKKIFINALHQKILKNDFRAKIGLTVENQTFTVSQPEKGLGATN